MKEHLRDGENSLSVQHKSIEFLFGINQEKIS